MELAGQCFQEACRDPFPLSWWAAAPDATADPVAVAFADGADAGPVNAGLRKAVGGSGGRVLTKEQWIRAGCPRTDRTTRLGLLPVLGTALRYTGISLVNTMIMATSGRVREPAVLRLAGAPASRDVLVITYRHKP